MQINVTAERIDRAQAIEPWLTTAEPEDPGQDPVAPGELLMQIRIPDLTSPSAATQNGTEGQPVTYARTHLMAATRGTTGTIVFSDAVTRGRHRQADAQMAFGESVQHLVGNRNMKKIEIRHGRQA